MVDDSWAPDYDKALENGYKTICEAENGVSKIGEDLVDYVERQVEEHVDEWGADPEGFDPGIDQEKVIVSRKDDHAKAFVYGEAYEHCMIPVARLPLPAVDRETGKKRNKLPGEFRLPSNTEAALEINETNIRHLLTSQTL